MQDGGIAPCAQTKIDADFFITHTHKMPPCRRTRNSRRSRKKSGKKSRSPKRRVYGSSAKSSDIDEWIADRTDEWTLPLLRIQELDEELETFHEVLLDHKQWGQWEPGAWISGPSQGLYANTNFAQLVDQYLTPGDMKSLPEVDKQIKLRELMIARAKRYIQKLNVQTQTAPVSLAAPSTSAAPRRSVALLGDALEAAQLEAALRATRTTGI